MNLHKRCLLAPLFLSFCFFLSPATGQTASVPKELSNQINKLVDPHSKAGLISGVISVSKKDEVLFERADGFANWELRVPNKPSNRFGIGSITKPFTKIIIQQLVRSGRIDPETPVEKYIPGFPRGSGGGRPSVRHLLTHRAGVPHRVTTPVDETQLLHTSDIVERVKKQGLLFEPGSRRLYSSAGYTCLARIIEIVEKKPFETVIKDRIFEPAEMSFAESETGQNLLPLRAMPYRLGSANRKIVTAKAPFKDLRFLTGAGSVYATVDDLKNFIKAVQNGVFGKELREEIFGGDGKNWRSLYGRTNGYEASIDILPAENLIFVFLTNLQSASTGQLREQIKSILRGQTSNPVPLPPTVSKEFEKPESIVGTYGSARVTIIDGKLFRGDNEFYPTGGKLYYIPGSGTSMKFRRNSKGIVDALISIRPGGRESVLLKTPN